MSNNTHDTCSATKPSHLSLDGTDRDVNFSAQFKSDQVVFSINVMPYLQRASYPYYTPGSYNDEHTIRESRWEMSEPRCTAKVSTSVNDNKLTQDCHSMKLLIDEVLQHVSEGRISQRLSQQIGKVGIRQIQDKIIGFNKLLNDRHAIGVHTTEKQTDELVGDITKYNQDLADYWHDLVNETIHTLPKQLKSRKTEYTITKLNVYEMEPPIEQLRELNMFSAVEQKSLLHKTISNMTNPSIWIISDCSHRISPTAVGYANDENGNLIEMERYDTENVRTAVVPIYPKDNNKIDEIISSMNSYMFELMEEIRKESATYTQLVPVLTIDSANTFDLKQSKLIDKSRRREILRQIQIDWSGKIEKIAQPLISAPAPTASSVLRRTKIPIEFIHPREFSHLNPGLSNYFTFLDYESLEDALQGDWPFTRRCPIRNFPSTETQPVERVDGPLSDHTQVSDEAPAESIAVEVRQESSQVTGNSRRRPTRRDALDTGRIEPPEDYNYTYIS
ncbi:uncharacterized protein I206_101381 [Kwoniella pini CBS 10737]|uniref:Uncharacterized protein n=1 Tax=Kwoniella pini CBS 10737 TaxID=1296096 RepID=A0A1B9HWU3_9TREE|nr:uncharacterized protein I206_06649 [Kwoniella pini CBS 10737]OCF47743.1 hypothetical protein I206_06649 [Kwoniella pini CBS 10737]